MSKVINLSNSLKEKSDTKIFVSIIIGRIDKAISELTPAEHIPQVQQAIERLHSAKQYLKDSFSIYS